MKVIVSLLLLITLSSAVYQFTVKNSTEEKTVLREMSMPVQANTLTDAEIKQGWISLFDGKTTNGWHVYQHQSDGSAWKVVDGSLTLDTTQKKDWQTVGGGDLLTDSSFENFLFSVDWKITKNGNSGIIFGVQDDPKYKYAWYTGPEMQVLDNEGHPDAKLRRHRAGDLYDLVACSKETVKPYDVWNHAEIKLDHGKLDLFLNGENVVSTTMWDDQWNKLVAASKFKDMPDFGKFKSGHIALQDHGNKVFFKNIKIKKL